MTDRTETTSPATIAVRVPGPLRELTGGDGDLCVAATTVGAAIDALLARHPRLRRHLRTEAGGLREHVNVYRNDEDVRHLAGEATPLEDGDEVVIVPSIAGG